MSIGPDTLSRASVRSGCGSDRRSSTSSRSPVSWNANRSKGSTASTRRIPLMFGLRRSDGRFSPTICHRAPGAKPRRSGCRPPIPGHQSGRWYGSDRNAHTSARGASSSRAASNVGDRKSTRLNSSHITISYAVFCLKKKKKKHNNKKKKKKKKKRQNKKKNYTTK